MLTGSAIDSWQKRWGTEEGRADWLDAHPEVAALVPELKARGARRVLDLGCGVGRHAMLLAEAGFEVDAFDGAESGLGVLRETATARGLTVGLKHGNADALPYSDASFDYVLSWNVIYHGTLGDAGARIAEIWRVLKPGGLYQGTMLPTRNSNYGRGKLVAPNTFVVDDPDEERAHTHFYCDAAVLVSLFSGFDLLSLSQRLQNKPGSWHWHLIAERLSG
jgi:ubiquinone/menaquinone biosynthesis C-methylase UbiE